MDKQNHLDKLFRTARDQQPVYSLGDAKKNFLSAVSSNSFKTKAKNSSFYSLNNWIIMIITVSTLVVAFVFFTPSEKKSLENKTTAFQSVKSVTSAQDIEKDASNTSENNRNSSFHTFKVVLDSLQKKESHIADTTDFTAATVLDNQKTSIPKLNDEYPFPKLTDKEISANHKQKKEMLKALEKFDKKVYAHIPSGTFDYLGKQISVQSFYIQKTEITNLEYRTFLFDLLIQGRKDEFLIAKPDQHLWVVFSNGGMKSLEENYFSSTDFNDFPVVNISREGAELYCKWLTQELWKYVGDEQRNVYNDVRLPFREEWVKAASVEGKQLPYPWNGNQIKNADGAILANCVIGYSNDTLDIDTNSPNYNIMAPVKSYWPNNYGIYNLAGNVAEMVYDDYKARLAGTAGGDWKTHYEGVKILAPDAYKNIISPMPTIGFRIVMTVTSNKVK